MDSSVKRQKVSRSEKLVFEDIKEEQSNVGSALYNPRKALSLSQQRALLPAAKRRGDVLKALEEHRSLVVMGSTGSGKTTQIPQFLLEAGWCEGDRAVLVTEPRRVAAVAAAERVAAEIGSTVGEEVGVAIRFDNRTSTKTRLVFSTEGTALRSMMSNPLLSRYSVVMVDEAHERSVTCDLLLGLLKKVQQRRSDLRIIVCSATINADEFVTFLGEDQTAIVNIEGKSYPVDVSYLKSPCKDYLEESLNIVVDIHRHSKPSSGSILVFLSSSEECEELTSRVTETLGRQVVAVPLYASLPSDQQIEALEPAPPNRRKVIAATNVAETSLSIDGVAFVVDTLHAKLKSFSSQEHVSSLSLVPISKASATQRAGRAGRTRPGQCFRCCTISDFSQLSETTPPEIQRVSLTGAILQLKSFGVDNIMNFQFPSAPPVEVVAQALEELYHLGAIDDDGILTEDIGMRMAEIPLEPDYARSLVASEAFGCTEEVSEVFGMVQSSTLLISPSASRERRLFEAVREPYAVAEGDLLTYLNMFRAYKSNGYSSSWCSSKRFNGKGFKQARRIAHNLKKFVDKKKSDSSLLKERLDTRLRKALCTGLFHKAAFVSPNGSYTSLLSSLSFNHVPLRMHPTSVLFDRYPKCVVYAEAVETANKYMRNVTAVEATWLVEVAPGLYENKRKRALMELEEGHEKLAGRP
mmetsp:Transcript_1285/g.3788  ORF Transcript_1285/g.3788 Transcript_1285/m.3788 type:complete len:694 (-) Transcript_1285:3142-5223(-)|eukprot:CAMPEP_0113960046 /NCGR_PEP_ID=MMETSP0011_2-20120614/4491_1 /TAXON_ID=101924 /ORGANISM="Rhodosorus marinus" /LENGTH=693 /DNA_ID=CAMNT_0000971443 /DNA_START=757 /DNA_END=2838 /DNA_ORIENTATION=+ /assembly_acc=CAM_ASM_000156